jgi:hypothetical protein
MADGEIAIIALFAFFTILGGAGLFWITTHLKV